MVQFFSSDSNWFATIDCADWWDFRYRANMILKPRSEGGYIANNFIFRGQACRDWGLKSSFDRGNEDLPPGEIDEKYKKLISTFKRNYLTYGNIAGDRNKQRHGGDSEDHTDQKMEAFAQHFGLPTRLLDWSYSLYVAAYFSFSNTASCESGLVSVWCLSNKAFDKFSRDHLERVDEIDHQNERKLFQFGCFTRNRTAIRDLELLFMDGSKHINSRSADEDYLLYRFDIPSSAETDAMEDLHMMRINSMTIFPGIEGVVRWMRDGGVLSN